MRERRQLWQQYQDRCVHFVGLMRPTCDAGVEYESVRDESTRPYRYPCFRDGSDVDGSHISCDQARFRTEKEARAQEAESRKRVQEFFDKALDTGGGVRGEHVDVWHPSRAEALEHGVQWREVRQVVEVGE